MKFPLILSSWRIHKTSLRDFAVNLILIFRISICFFIFLFHKCVVLIIEILILFRLWELLHWISTSDSWAHNLFNFLFRLPFCSLRILDLLWCLSRCTLIFNRGLAWLVEVLHSTKLQLLHSVLLLPLFCSICLAIQVFEACNVGFGIRVVLLLFFVCFCSLVLLKGVG